MSNQPFQRSWVSPITALSFAAVAVTGLIMLLHLRVPGVKTIHDWMGVLLCLVGFVHLGLNSRTFMTHFRQKAAWGAVAAGLVILLVALFVPGQDNHSGREFGAASRTTEAPRF